MHSLPTQAHPCSLYLLQWRVEPCVPAAGKGGDPQSLPWHEGEGWQRHHPPWDQYCAQRGRQEAHGEGMQHEAILAWQHAQARPPWVGQGSSWGWQGCG